MTTTVQAAVHWNKGIEDAWSRVASFVPKLAAFLVILLIGYLVAKALAKVVDTVLQRVGFDRAVERGGVKQALSRSRYDASDLVGKIVFYAVMLLALQTAFGVFGANPVNHLIAGVIAYLPKVFAALVIVVVAAAIASAARDLVGNALGGLSYGRTLANLAGVAIVTVGAFAALSQLQIAPMIVNGLFYGLLAVVVGSAIVAVGGGGIQPMRMRWERALSAYDREKPRIQREMQRSETPALDEQVMSEGSADVTGSAAPASAAATRSLPRTTATRRTPRR